MLQRVEGAVFETISALQYNRRGRRTLPVANPDHRLSKDATALR